MIGTLRGIDASAALAWCMAQPGAIAADCRQEVVDHTVGGVYCDGTIVMASGAPKRCVPTGVLAGKLAAEKKTPLPPPPVVADARSGSGEKLALFGVVALVLVGGIYLASR